MDLDAVLELIRSATERYETMPAALRYRGDDPTIKAVLKRFLRSEASRRTYGEPSNLPEDIDHSEPDGTFGCRCRIWRADNHRWRQEAELPGGRVDIRVSTERMRIRGTPEGPPGTSEQWRERIGGGRREEDPSWPIATINTF